MECRTILFVYFVRQWNEPSWVYMYVRKWVYPTIPISSRFLQDVFIKFTFAGVLYSYYFFQRCLSHHLRTLHQHGAKLTHKTKWVLCVNITVPVTVVWRQTWLFVATSSFNDVRYIISKHYTNMVLNWTQRTKWVLCVNITVPVMVVWSNTW